MAARILIALDRFNGAHPWSHNDAYSYVVLREARKVRRAGGTRALDVGCGTGNLVARLASVLDEVTGLEPDAVTASLASAALSTNPNVRIVHGRFPQDAQPQFDLVSMVAVLHHLPLDEAVRQARQAVAPDGRLVIVGCYRETRADLPLSMLSLLLNPLVGAIKHPRRASRPLQHMTAPTKNPDETFADIKQALQDALPGVSVHRGPFWRYLATWQAAAR